MSTINSTPRKPTLVRIGDALAEIVGSAIVAGCAVAVVVIGLNATAPAAVPERLAAATAELRRINADLAPVLAKIEAAR